VWVRGPLEAFASGFSDELRGVGYSPVAAVFQLQLMAHASRWLDAAGLGPDALTRDVVERFLAERRAADYTNYVTARAMAPLLGYLRAIGVAPVAVRPQAGTPAERLLERFGEYLTIERGLAAGTVVDYVHAVRPFLAAIGGDGELDLQRLSAADVTAFVVARCPRQSRGEAITTYLRDGRPASAQDRSLFVRVKAPHSGLTTGGITQVVVSAGRRAGLGQIHAHRLRHTAATQMLRAGGSLEEIGQVLRHRAASRTAIYAKVDRNALRQLARPWPWPGERS
jgi:hypothetical protein